MELTIPHSNTALVLIDLQRGIVGRDNLAPRSGQEVVDNASLLAEAFRQRGALVVLVHVDFAKDGGDALQPPVDAPQPAANRPSNWAEIVPALGPKKSDIVIQKHQWGAFYGTELDLQLRRRGIDTIVLGGIATNMGVESTARDAYERGYALIFAEDAMASMGADLHEFAVTKIFPRIGRVRSTSAILAAI